MFHIHPSLSFLIDKAITHILFICHSISAIFSQLIFPWYSSSFLSLVHRKCSINRLVSKTQIYLYQWEGEQFISMGPKITWYHCNSIPCLLCVRLGKFGPWQLGGECDKLIFAYELIRICGDISVGEMLICFYHSCCLKIHQAQRNNYINHPKTLAGCHASWSYSLLQNDYSNLLVLERTVNTVPGHTFRSELRSFLTSMNSAVKWLYSKLEVMAVTTSDTEPKIDTYVDVTTFECCDEWALFFCWKVFLVFKQPC